MTTLRVGRNASCPCGSGRKYKVCCLRRDSTDGAIRASPLAQPRPVFGDGADTRRTQPQLARPAGDERPVLRIPIHYAYPEPFGEAECVYCFPVDQLFIFSNGNVIRAEQLQPSMQFRMQEGGLATVTAVEPPKLWGPPSRVPDQFGRYPRRVLGTIKHKGFVLVDVTFGGQTVSATPNHPFYSVTRKAWVPVGSMWPGELLRNGRGDVTPLQAISEQRYGVVEVFNLEVEELHNYFVGNSDADSVLVHNGPEACIGKPAQPMREVEVKDLKPIQGGAHSAPRPGLQKLTDAELLGSVRNPAKGDFLTENTRTGALVDGNGRAHELLRRATDPNSSIKPGTKVPVAPYTPDMSMFPDLP